MSCIRGGRPDRAGPASRWLCALVLAVAALAPPAARAFGADGHRIVAELAQRRLAPAAAAEVRRLLDGEADPTLTGIANWADEVRDREAYRWSAPLHYVNFPRDSCRYDAARDCRDGRCVVAAIERYARELHDRRLGDERRRAALKWLVHFVADVHQPLHAGYADDKGGNTFQVFYAGRGSNLHALWDSLILDLPRRGWRDYAGVLAARSAGRDLRWSPQAAQRWAEQSCRLIAAAAIYPERPGRLNRAYAERQLPVVERQLVLAGARLAALLNAELR